MVAGSGATFPDQDLPRRRVILGERLIARVPEDPLQVTVVNIVAGSVAAGAFVLQPPDSLLQIDLLALLPIVVPEPLVPLIKQLLVGRGEYTALGQLSKALQEVQVGVTSVLLQDQEDVVDGAG